MLHFFDKLQKLLKSSNSRFVVADYPALSLVSNLGVTQTGTAGSYTKMEAALPRDFPSRGNFSDDIRREVTS
ncbi:MAG: hypothetical protein AAGJ18_06840 [Bacteroidota bacterium]